MPIPLPSRRWLQFLAVALFACATSLRAAPDALDAADADTLRPHVGEPVTVHGTITGSGQNKAGTVGYLNFAKPHAGVALVFFFKEGTSGKATGADDLKPFVGKTVTISGKLADYKGDLQITVETLDDLKVTP